MGEPSWHSVHVYYYEPNKDALLLDCIRPLIAGFRERGWADRAYFVRHWQGGPHVRLNVFADPALFQQEIAPYAVGQVEAYLRTHPSRATLTEAEARRQFQQRANRSREEIVYEPLRPDNSVRLALYDDRSAAIGSEGAARLLEDYYVETNDLVFAIIEQSRDDYTGRFNASFSQLVAVAATCPDMPVTHCCISYRSHAEAYMVFEPEIEAPAIRRRRLEEAYRQRHDLLLRRTRTLLDQIEHAPERLPSWLSEVIAVHRRYYDRALHGAEDGSVTVITSADTEKRGTAVLLESEFHQALLSKENLIEMFTTPRMLAWRIMINLLYLHLSRIGLRNDDRYILDYYIVEAVEELFNFSALESVKHGTRVYGGSKN